MNDIDEKTVREARTRARRLAKTTELTYQQALDKVAAEMGHADWTSLRNTASPHDPTAIEYRNPVQAEPRRARRWNSFADAVTQRNQWAAADATGTTASVELHRRIARRTGLEPMTIATITIFASVIPEFATSSWLFGIYGERLAFLLTGCMAIYLFSRLAGKDYRCAIIRHEVSWMWGTLGTLCIIIAFVDAAANISGAHAKLTLFGDLRLSLMGLAAHVGGRMMVSGSRTISALCEPWTNDIRKWEDSRRRRLRA